MFASSIVVMKRSLENIGTSPVRTRERNELYIAASHKMSAPSSAGQEPDFSVRGRGLRRESAVPGLRHRATGNMV